MTEDDRPPLTGLCPLIAVWDMPRAIAFYRDALGFAVVHHTPEIAAAEGRYFHWAHLKRGPAELMLNTAYDSNERPAETDATRWKGHGDVCLYINCADVDAAYADLVAHGVAVGPPADASYGLRQIFVTDPDGYVLAFQSPVTA